MDQRHRLADALLLAEILAARLCHDLSGQVNALSGALEVMREEASLDPEALELASDASTLLVQRLKLARAAWGRAGPPMGVDEWRLLVEAMPRRGVELHLDGVDTSAGFAPEAARLSLNVLMLAAEALPAGGVIEAAGHPGQDMIVRIRGLRAAWPAGLATMLADPEAALDAVRSADRALAPRLLQAPLTALLAHVTGQRVALLLGAPSDAPPPLLVNLTQRH